MTSTKVLVTGAAGFIGSAVVRQLALLGFQVVAIDGLLGGLYPNNEKAKRFREIATIPGVEVLELDLRTSDLDQLPPDISHVINQAAMSGLGLSWSNFDLYATCNISALARLIERAQEWKLERFIQISTSSVYGKSAVGDESLETGPVSPYGATKLAAEHLALAHWRDSSLPVTILRYFSVYGPGQRPDMAYRKFISSALHGVEINKYGSGNQSRSNTYIDDCVDATISALSRSQPGEVYNIAGSSEHSLNEALDLIALHTGKELNITAHPAARGDQLRTFGDSTKAQNALGFRNSVDLNEGLRRQVEWQVQSGLV